MRQKMSGARHSLRRPKRAVRFFIFCILEVLALDNPRTAAYNKVIGKALTVQTAGSSPV